MINPLSYIILFVLSVMTACKSTVSSKATTGSNMANESSSNSYTQSNYRQIAESKLGKGADYAMNNAQTMVLCKKSEEVTAPAMINSIHFLVISLENNTVLYEDKVANAQINWFTDTQLKINTFPGTVQNTPDKKNTYYIYDLETKQKISPGSEKF